MPRSRVSAFAWIVAIAFIVGTALTYVDRLDLVATPPPLPEGTNMVDRAIAAAGYRQAIYPVFLWTNLAFAVGFAAAVTFGWLVASRWGGTGRLPMFVSFATVGGVIGTLASLIPLGAVNASVWQLYCDCGFKETEIIAGDWAQMVASDVADWFNRFGAVLLALALVALVREIGDRLPRLFVTWSYVTAVALVGYAVTAVIGVRAEPLPDLLTTAIGLVLVPVWAVWLGRSIEATAGTAAAEAG